MVQLDEYCDLHRVTLQTLMGHGAIEVTEFDKIFRCIWQKFAQDNSMQAGVINKVIEKINEKIGTFDQKIIIYEYGLTNKNYYIFYSTAKTSMSKLQNSYSEAELDLFKLILTKITENEDLTIAPREALNLISQITGSKLNKLRAQKLLDNWIESNYFYKHDDNKIYLGAKILTEFKELLQSMELNYLKSCLLCENIAAWGDRCASCDTIYHSVCIRKFLSRSGKCPSCKEKWELDGEAAADDDEVPGPSTSAVEDTQMESD